MSRSDPLVQSTARGLYCPAGDFFIDPWQPVQTAVITHGHGDHLRAGSARYILARAGLAIARQRLPGTPELRPLEYGERIVLGEVTVSLHPAGHILGSAQVRLERSGEVWVVSGDYKRQSDPTSPPLEVLPCDVFVSEATFALPVYRWPATALQVEEIVRWWRGNRERGIASVLFCYALGKAQRVLAELNAFTSDPVHLHGALRALTEIYREAGVTMVPTVPATTETRKDYRGALILAPPSAAGTPWMRRFGEHSSGFCSGWMRVRGERRRRGYHRGFVISDHADWPGLVDTCLGTGAPRVLLTHGYADALCRFLSARGIQAAALATEYGGDD